MRLLKHNAMKNAVVIKCGLYHSSTGCILQMFEKPNAINFNNTTDFIIKWLRWMCCSSIQGNAWRIIFGFRKVFIVSKMQFLYHDQFHAKNVRNHNSFHCWYKRIFVPSWQKAGERFYFLYFFQIYDNISFPLVCNLNWNWLHMFVFNSIQIELSWLENF